MQAQVAKVEGTVQYALATPDGAAGEWKTAQVGDLLPAGAVIRTRLRSKVILTFGDDTIVLIDRATLASIDQFHRSEDTKRVKLGLGHGAVRAGVAETTLRSDMTIATPTATLSKKGTIDFGIEYEPSTGRFKVDLAREGLIEILNRLTGQARSIHPGQYVTQAMIRWIETAVFDRNVVVTDVFGLTAGERLFMAMNSSGSGVANPGGGATSNGSGAPGGGAGGGGAGGLGGILARGGVPPLAAAAVAGRVVDTLRPGSRIIDRPEGNFGTGGGRLPSILGGSK